MKKLISLLALAVLLSTGCASKPDAHECCANKQEKEAITTPDQAIAELVAGNKRFCENKTLNYNQTADYAKQFTKGQDPFALVITCSDSRVPAEILFDQGCGDIFVIRTAGNTVMDNETAASVDYAVNHLNVKVIVTLGHTYCGAVTGVVTPHDSTAHAVENDEQVAELLHRIGQCIPSHEGQGISHLDSAIVENANYQVETIKDHPNVIKKMDAGQLKVVSAIYDLATAKVEFK